MATAFQEYVECPICINLLQPPGHEPLILPCLHTVCAGCFDKMRTDSQIQCPLCNTVSDNAFVKKDFRTASLVEAFLKASNRHTGRPCSTQICGICEEVKVIECKCLQCDKMLCMSCVRGHKAIKELAAHPLASIADIAQKTRERMVSVKSRLETLVGKYDEAAIQLHQQAAALDQTEVDAVGRLNRIESSIIRGVQNHFDGLRKSIASGKERVFVEVETPRWQVIADRRDVGNHLTLLSNTINDDAFSIFSNGAAILNNAMKVADEKESSIPPVKRLAYSVDVVEGVRFDPSNSATIRIVAEVVEHPGLAQPDLPMPQPATPTMPSTSTHAYSVPMWSDPLNDTRQEIYDQLNWFEVLRSSSSAAVVEAANPQLPPPPPGPPPPPQQPSNPSWSEVVQDQSKPRVLVSNKLGATAAPVTTTQFVQVNSHPANHMPQPPTKADDWQVVGNKTVSSPVEANAASADLTSTTTTCERYVKTKSITMRRTAYRLQLYPTELWCTTDNALHVVSLECERVRTVPLQGVGYARAVVRTSTGKLLVADCDKEDMKYEDGLKLLDANGEFVKILMHKKTCDVTIYKGKAYALRHKQAAVYVFRDAGNDQWVQENKIQLLGYYKGLGMHTVCIQQDMIYLCPKNCQAVYVYTLAGRITGCYGKKGWNLQVGLDLSMENSTAGALCDARICGDDGKGNVLIADSTNQKLQVLKEGGHWAEITLEKNTGIWDAVIGQSGQAIWAIEGRNNVAKYKKVSKA